MLATPSKRPRSNDRRDTEEMHQNPLNVSKNNIISDLLTPAARRTRVFSTPASRTTVSKLHLDDTPAFLRRESQRADVGKENVLGDEEEISWSPLAILKVPKAAGRGLSALVRGLREMEDEELDEGLDMLREMERESASSNHLDQPKIHVSDSRRSDMPLGPDGGLLSDEDGVDNAGDGKGRDGKPLEVWKKKGQKRTTKRVLIKPNSAKWKPEPAWKVSQANADEETGVAEIQTLGADRLIDYGCESDEYQDIEVSQEATRAANARNRGLDRGSEQKKVLAKKVKKISATAHANFRALKIKNKQSKAKKGGINRRKR